MKYILIIFITLFIVFPLFPGVASAQLNIWEDTGQPGRATCNIDGPCTFCDALKVTSNVVQLLFQVAIPIAVAMIIYGALRLMFAGGSQERITQSRKIMTSAVIGLIIALSAWIIVNTLLHVLTGNPSFPWNEITCS
ncbi:MAG: pilin [Patescibacteria group bacterium]|nr:pilin [Patescibacteria group bacterium]